MPGKALGRLTTGARQRWHRLPVEIPLERGRSVRYLVLVGTDLSDKSRARKRFTRTIMSAHKAWRNWLGTHGSQLMLYARQLTRCEADAEDVVQTALVKTWRYLADSDSPRHDSKHPEGHRGLIFTNIRRCAIDLGRSHQRRKRRDRRMAEHFGAEARAQASWFELPDDDEVRQLQVALAKIPLKFREVITLKIWGELTFAEIADSLSLSPNTAASRYRYGLEALRTRLGNSITNPNSDSVDDKSE